jgi:PAS domain S-box-containing protein
MNEISRLRGGGNPPLPPAAAGGEDSLGPHPSPPPPLDSVLITEALWRRPARDPDFRAENQALITLAREMANSPGTVLQRLSDLLVRLCRADSAGVSILDPDGTAFRWPAISGPFAANIGGTLPCGQGPCGIVLERNAIQLFDRPARLYSELRKAAPPVFEALLAPFPVGGRPGGTVWVISHHPDRRFDAEDARLLGSLARFASAAHRMAAALAEAEKARAALEQRMEERARAEAGLRAAHARTIEILESLSDAFYALDQDGRFTYVNRRAEELWGRPRGTLIGRLAREAFPQLVGTPLQEAARTVLREKLPARLELHSAILGAWFEVDIHPVATGGISVYLRDISERKRATERQALLMREVDHRAKNALAVVQAAIRLTEAPDVPSYARALEGRIAALARAQTLLAQDRWTGADLR